MPTPDNRLVTLTQVRRLAPQVEDTDRWNAALDAALAAADAYCGQPLLRHSVTGERSETCAGRLFFRHRPIISVQRLLVDGAELDAADFPVWAERYLDLSEVVGTTRPALVEVDYTAGWQAGEAPANLRLAIALLTVKNEGLTLIGPVDSESSGGETTTYTATPYRDAHRLLDAYKAWRA